MALSNTLRSGGSLLSSPPLLFCAVNIVTENHNIQKHVPRCEYHLCLQREDKLITK